MDSAAAPPSLRRPAALVLARIPALAGAYVIAGLLVGELAMPPGYVSPVWPAAGIALVAAMAWGWAAVPGIVLGSFVVDLHTSLEGGKGPLGAAMATSALIGLGAGAQAMLGAWLARRACGPGNPLETGASVPRSLLLGGPVACVLNAVWGTGVLLVTRHMAPGDVPRQVVTWWVGDTIGVLLVAPVLLASLASPAVWNLRRWASLAVPLSVSLVGVIALFVETRAAAREEALDAFQAHANVVTTTFGSNVGRAEAYTESVARAFGAFPAIDRAAFRAMVSPWLQANAVVEAFEWAPVVPGSRLAAFEAASRDPEFPAFHVTELAPGDGRLVPAAPRAVHVPLLFVEPLSRERSAVGYDLASSPARVEALDAARDSGHVVGTGAVRLVLYPGEWGVLLVAAAYNGVEPPRDLAERRAGVRGYVATVIRVDELVRQALSRAGERTLAARVTDLSAAPPLVLSGAAASDVTEERTWSTTLPLGGRTWRVDVVQTDPIQESWIGWSVLAAGLACTGLVASFVLDATARSVQIERIVRERTAELAHSNEALSRSNLELQRFAYVASHDMREPLRTIACYSELVEREAGDRLDEDSRGWLRRVVSATRRMQELVAEILAFARVESRVEVREPVPLAEPARAALVDLDAEVRASGAAVVVGELPVARCDRVQMVQLFQNLLSNALKFRRPGVPLRVQVGGRRVDDRVEVTVEDNGIGIEPKHWERIFEMFQRLHADARYPGQGIGLATCRRIVERHGGRIWVTSTPGAGSVFHFTLPAPTA